MLERVYPEGTMMVTRVAVEPGDGGRPRPRGACAIVVKSPEHIGGDYRLRFPDGGEFWVAASELAVLKHYQEGELLEGVDEAQVASLFDHVHYRCVVGSRAYGLDHEASDMDVRGFYVAPATLQWSLFGAPEQLERPREDVCYWEVEKFIKLALKANPNVLECLYTPLVEHTSPVAAELLDERHIFLSQMIYQTYSRYVMSQFKTMHRQRAAGEEVRPKHAMHLIRLMMSGVRILQEGFVPVSAGEERERLLAIKRGELDWDEIEAWRISLHEAFDEALRTTALPERPDYARANELLLKIRRWAAEQ